MKDSFERRQRLQEAFPEASASALEYLPETFDQSRQGARFFPNLAGCRGLSVDAQQARSRAWPASGAFPGMVGPGFDELGLKYAGDFLAGSAGRRASTAGFRKKIFTAPSMIRLKPCEVSAREVRARHLAAEVEALSERSNRPR